MFEPGWIINKRRHIFIRLECFFTPLQLDSRISDKVPNSGGA